VPRRFAVEVLLSLVAKLPPGADCQVQLYTNGGLISQGAPQAGARGPLRLPAGNPTFYPCGEFGSVESF
jgi:hypothetical protein